LGRIGLTEYRVKGNPSKTIACFLCGSGVQIVLVTREFTDGSEFVGHIFWDHPEIPKDMVLKELMAELREIGNDNLVVVFRRAMAQY
jgi:hypothetical protein